MIFPDYNATEDKWIMANATLFDSQLIDCSYPISGGYGRGPRYSYYFLVFFAVVVRRQTWIVSVALASVMTFSGVAIIHAISLAAMRTQLVPTYVLENYEVILVGGRSSNGSWVSSTPENWLEFGLWLPVLPMAWDSDGDAVLAIVGVAFLIITPMQTWSKTFKNSEGKAVLLLWSLLLLAGMICALVNEAYITVWTFPQLRFCPLHQNETLPMTNGGAESVGGVWDRESRYHWNDTVSKYFSKSTGKLSTLCIYPCFETEWPLRDSTEIIAHVGANAISTTTAYYIIFAVYVIVFSSGLSSLTIFLVNTYASASLLRIKNFSYLKKQWDEVFRSRPIFCRNTARRAEMALYISWLQLVNIYAKILSPIAPVSFVVYAEWILWYDQPGENFRHVGQWGPLVATALVAIAAAVDHFRPEFMNFVDMLVSRYQR
ncbi:hypothetical protein MMC22_004981 [Lobaria immixta]|nr:hypothetical protein [Lobaria immixta]